MIYTCHAFCLLFRPEEWVEMLSNNQIWELHWTCDFGACIASLRSVSEPRSVVRREPRVLLRSNCFLCDLISASSWRSTCCQTDMSKRLDLCLKSHKTKLRLPLVRHQSWLRIRPVQIFWSTWPTTWSPKSSTKSCPKFMKPKIFHQKLSQIYDPKPLSNVNVKLD